MTVSEIITDEMEKYLQDYVHISEVEEVALELQIELMKQRRFYDSSRD